MNIQHQKAQAARNSIIVKESLRQETRTDRGHPGLARAKCVERQGTKVRLAPIFEQMPPELVELPRWVNWRAAKVPIDPNTSRPASINKPSTWSCFAKARETFRANQESGVGFVLNGDGVIGLDLDHCVRDGVIAEQAQALLAALSPGYVELSPSGCGIRAFGYGLVARGVKGELNGVNVELYGGGRYLTVTGHRIKAEPLRSFEGLGSFVSAIRRSGKTGAAEQMTSDSSESSVSSVASVASVASVSSVEFQFPLTCHPDSPGQRNKCLFALARYLKGKYPAMKRDDLREIVKRWHADFLSVIGTKDFATTWGDFARSWESVTHPHGHTFGKALERANMHSLPVPGMDQFSYGQSASRLAWLCFELQREQGGEPFFLSSRTAGDTLGIHFSEAAATLRAFVADGVLALVEQGRMGYASRYRWAWAPLPASSVSAD